jgi:spore photoproduct lyase
VKQKNFFDPYVLREHRAGPHYPLQRMYLEEAVENSDADLYLQKRFPQAKRHIISSYQEVFHSRRSNFQIQKQAGAVILAKDNGRLLYRGTERVNSFGIDLDRFFYVSQLRNCLFNCDYCFLQGMHVSGYPILFLNHKDVVSAVKAELAKGPLYLSVSYMSDMLAFEPLLPYTAQWLFDLPDLDGCTLEIRSKSDYIQPLLSQKPNKQVVLSFSLSPQSQCSNNERGTAHLKNRLMAASRAAQAGWRIRLCFDPILDTENFESVYAQLFKDTFERLDPGHIEFINYGFFRMAQDHLEQIRNARPEVPWLFEKFYKNKAEMTYKAERRDRMRLWVERELEKYYPIERTQFVEG